MKVREVIVLIESDGWYMVRTKGSHRQFKHSEKLGTVTVAGKPGLDVPQGTLNSILKTSGAEVMQYAIIIEKSATGYGAYVPDLPGCVAVAETEGEVRALIREAVEFHLESLQEEGTPIPAPSSRVEYIEVQRAA